MMDAASFLERRVRRIDALNVFPVPDGDTGTNLMLTMRAAIEAARAHGSNDVGTSAATLARGALIGAHGNSGVILSQYLRGIARSFEGCGSADAGSLARALDEGALTARAAVDQPVEGTMLTVARDAARAASDSARSGSSLGDVLRAVEMEVRDSVARTRGSLPALRRADVVDAGALGLATILEGMARSSRGEPLPDGSEEEAERPAAMSLETEAFGFCTQFVIRGNGLDSHAIRARLKTFGDSALAVGDSSMVRVHLHTFRPSQAIEDASSFGVVDQIEVEDMQDQNRRLRAFGHLAHPQPACALVVIVEGDGFAELFRSLGASVVSETATTTTLIDEIWRAIRASDVGECVVLLNQPDRIEGFPDTRSAVGLTDSCVTIVSAGNPARGVAAALAFQPERAATENVRAMNRALIEIQSARISSVPGDSSPEVARCGAVTGLANGDFEIVGDDLTDVVVEVLERLGASTCEIITLYSGSGVSEDDLNALQVRVRATFPRQQVDSVRGGQSRTLLDLSCE